MEEDYGNHKNREEIAMKENIKMIKNVVRASINGPMEIILKDNLKMIYDMAMAKCIGLMVDNIKVDY